MTMIDTAGKQYDSKLSQSIKDAQQHFERALKYLDKHSIYTKELSIAKNKIDNAINIIEQNKGIIRLLIDFLITIVRYKIIRYKKFMPPDKPLYQ